MKKKLIALAVAGALTAPMVAQANATLYNTPLRFTEFRSFQRMIQDQHEACYKRLLQELKV